MNYFSLCLFCLLITSSIVAQSIVYVTPSGAGTGSGSSWLDALPGTQLASRVSTASAGTQFWIAAGTYKPTTNTDRTASFSIASGVQLYGGFWGTETTIAQRPGYSDLTFLSGDIGVSGYAQDNSQHVISIQNGRQPVSIDGLTIRDGRIVSVDNASLGAGVYIAQTENSVLTLTISRCRFINNLIESSLSGGGAIGALAQNKGQVNLKIIDCFLAANQAGFGGAYTPITQGGYIQSSIVNCVFADNIGLNGAGAISNTESEDDTLNSLRIQHCQFSGNRALYFGGAIATGKSLCTVDNSLFNKNQVTAPAFGAGGAVDGRNGQHSTFRNCIFSANKAPRGGVVYAVSDNTNTVLTFINCNFINNSASISGGVFYNPLFSADQSNIAIPFSNATYLKNCLLWQNTAPAYPVYEPHVYRNSENFSNSLYVQSSLFQGLITQPGVIETGINLDTDPLFVDPLDENFKLKPNSPVIDAGAPDTAGLPPTDITGQPRIQGGRVDMGAYEFVDCAPTHCLPFTVERVR